MNGKYELVDGECAGPDGIHGTSDDFTVPYWYLTNLQDDPEYLLTNPKKGQSSTMLDDPNRSSKGFEIIFKKTMAKRWQLFLSYTYGISRGNTQYPLFVTLGTDPNKFTFAANQKLYCWGEPHHLRIQGSVILPLDINFGFIGSYMSGLPEAASSFNVKTPRSPYTFMQVKPYGEHKNPDRKDISINLEKSFNFGQRKMLTVMINVDNPFNWDTVSRLYYYGDLWKKIQNIKAPRNYHLSARFWF